MTQWGFYFNQQRCLGCATCTVACKEWNEGRRRDAKLNALTDGQLKNLETPKDWKAGTNDKAVDYEYLRKFDMKENWRRVTFCEFGKRAPNVEVIPLSMSCNHCSDPACMKVCPMKAIHKGPHGEVLVDQQKCIGCKMCANACPYDVPVFNTEGRTSYFGDKQPLVVRPAKPHTERTPGKAEHCTLCVHRTERGLLPACVEACGIHAMTLVDYDNPTPETAKLIEAARPMNEAAGTHPKIRYIARHMDAAKMAVKLG